MMLYTAPHEVTLYLAMCCRWLHWTPEMFMATFNLVNCGMLVLERQPPDEKGRDWYRLTDESVAALGIEDKRYHFFFQQTMRPYYDGSAADGLDGVK